MLACLCHVSDHVCSSPPLAMAIIHRTQQILHSRGKASLLYGVVLFLSSVTKTTHYGGGAAEITEDPCLQADGPAALS